VEWEETVTPLEALVREQELILDHRPPCNVFGRRPENYVYLKLAEGDRGARLYLSDRPGWPGRPAFAGEGRGLVLGPFRGRSRVQRTLDLLQRCYPIRRCAGRGTTSRPCLFGATGRCLAPCSGGEERQHEHNQLVNDLVGWLCSSGGPEEDPTHLATRLMKDLSSQQRYEDAEEVRLGLDDLRALRRSYRALAEALDLSYGVVWPRRDMAAATVRLDLVWRGRLVEKLDLTQANAGLDLGRVVRKLLAGESAISNGGSPKSGSSAVWVRQEELDLLLAARRWLLDSPGADVVKLPDGGPLEARLENWRRQLLELVESRLAQ
jgi:excinuclease UvrABC nuclease subunit